MEVREDMAEEPLRCEPDPVVVMSPCKLYDVGAQLGLLFDSGYDLAWFTLLEQIVKAK
jgi:hypothetical protein